MTHMSSLKTIVQLKPTNLKKKGTGLAEEEQGLTDPQEEKEGGGEGGEEGEDSRLACNMRSKIQRLCQDLTGERLHASHATDANRWDTLQTSALRW